MTDPNTTPEDNMREFARRLFANNEDTSFAGLNKPRPEEASE